MSLTDEEIRGLKKRVVTANVAMGYWYERMGVDQTHMTTGHVSARIPGTNLMVIKGRPPEGDLMCDTTLQKIVTVDINTVRKVAGEPDVNPPGEIELHTAIYAARPDVKAVAHGHGDFTILASLLDLDLQPFCNDKLALFNAPIPIFKNNALISTPELGLGMAKCMGKANAILLRGHGSVTASDKGPEDAMQSLMSLEEQAKLNFYVFSAVGKDYVKYAIPEKDRIGFLEFYRSGEQQKRPDRQRLAGVDLTVDLCNYNARMARLKC